MTKIKFTNNQVGIDYHGNWCGPGWSDGRWTSSTRGYAPAVDEFDETCRQHDFALAGGTSDPAADVEFFLSNFGRGTERTAAAVAVAARLGYDVYSMPQKQIFSIFYNMTKNPKQKQPKTKNVRNDTPTMRRNDSVRAAPIALATRRTGAAAVVKTTPGGVVVSHRSFLYPIVNNLNFTITAVPCNPGLSGSFPWLAKLARRYEQYRFKKLRYEFRSVVPSTQSGVVMMSFDYDAADSAATTKSEQAQTVPNSETNVWMNNDLVVRTESEWKYVRAGTLASNLDIKTYDSGNMWVSSCYGDNAVGGELYVEYVVEFRKPTDGPETCGKFSADTGSFAAPVNATNATVLGTAFPFTRTSNNDFTVVAGGEYLMVCEANGTTMTAAIAVPTISSASTTSVVSSLFNVVGASNTSRTIKLRVETGDIITFANAGTGATISNTRYYVAAIDYSSL